MNRVPLTFLAAAGITATVLAAGCATARPATAPGAPPPERVTFAPEEVVATPLDVELAGKNDEELFAIGTAAYAAKDYPRAAAAFSRVVDLHPASKHVPAALYDAGLAYQRTEQWSLALERFQALEKGWTGPDAVEASFRTAECLYHLDRLEDARAKLDRLAARTELPANEMVRALVQRGVVELELQRGPEAESSLKRALGVFETAHDRARVDEYFAAQAEYYLGEVYRTWFLALPLDPSKAEGDALEGQLRAKAEMLVAARTHYLKAVRYHDEAWAVSSGIRVGELYDALRSQLLDAPVPAGLTEEQVSAYRAELRKDPRLRVLLTKAVTEYRDSLSYAAASGVEVRYLEQAREALQRLETALAEGAREGT
ncbi:MAG: tetratricopeptide repeat protein [Anaeromyxobacteraceae bacterium]